jgi:hypothetical protein
MVKRTYSQLCHRDLQASDNTMLEGLANRFEQGGYKLRDLFEQVAVHPSCL